MNTENIRMNLLDSKAALKPIGTGSFGKIFLFNKSQEKFVVKQFNPVRMSKFNIPKIMSKLANFNKHENIIHFLDMFWDEKEEVYVEIMEYCECGDFFDNFYRFTVVQRLDLFEQALKGVQFLHENGIAHRDLKMENMMLCKNFTSLKLIDFELSSVFSEHQLTNISGTVSYIPPEQFHPTWHIRSKIFALHLKQDVWACGILLYQMINDEVPWEFESIHPNRNKDYQIYKNFGKFRSGDQILGNLGNLIRAFCTIDEKRRPCTVNSEIVKHYRDLLNEMACYSDSDSEVESDNWSEESANE